MVFEFVLNIFDTDPYFRSTYSNRIVDFHEKDFEALVAPHKSLPLTDESMESEEQYGYVKIEMESGARTAKSLIRKS